MPTMPGPLELLVVAALALIVFGPNKLPEMARSIGKAIAEFRRQASDIRAEFEYELDDEPFDEEDDPNNKPVAERKSAAAKTDDEAPAPTQDPDPETGEGSGAAPASAHDPDPENPS